NTLTASREAALVYETLRLIQEDVVHVELARVRANAAAADVMTAFDGTGTPLTYAQRTDDLQSQQQALAARYQKIWPEVKRIAAKKGEEKHGSGGKAALAWAHTKIGVKEHPPESNRGPQIDTWEREAGFLGSAWCGAFAKASAKNGGVVVTQEARYVPWLRNH